MPDDVARSTVSSTAGPPPERTTSGPSRRQPDARSELPVDPDVDSSVGPATPPRPRPLHRSPTNVLMVAAGGAVGTGLRYTLSAAIPHVHGVPVAIVGINVVGAFLLGVLLERLADDRLDPDRSRRLRLTLGTGVLGGFTTYSTLTTDTATLAAGHPGLALAYASTTLLVGALASVAGIGLARRRARTTPGTSS